MATKKVSKINLATIHGTCSSCAAFNLYEGEREMGECRYNPPLIHADEEGIFASFPPVISSEWCYKHVGKN
jgi:hypothetical protein